MGRRILTVKGRVSLPAGIRRQFAEEFEASLDKAREWAASVGYEESDVAGIVKSARRKKRT